MTSKVDVRKSEQLASMVEGQPKLTHYIYHVPVDVMMVCLNDSNIDNKDISASGLYQELLLGIPCDFSNSFGRFITELYYSSEPYWLKKACDLVFVILKEKSDLLKPDILTKLSLSLARAQMPVPASKMLRLMLEKGNLPP
ncbi:hypothetical protein EZV62_023774 [Acer yangbiense]|uniref:Uncharacterized protein n=1 Tax=Acer yangbiense TaxID=1000413 RepID=A0A5C7H2Q2_9ROSI|nr:hypothetical protein EZV62_023774 [Acer yangbiense]